MNCPKCNSGDVSAGQGEQKLKNVCQLCGFVWDDDSVIGAMAKTLADIKAKQDAMESWLNFLAGKQPMVCPECNSNEIVSNGYGEHGRMHRCQSCSFAWNDGSDATWTNKKSMDNSSIRLNSIEEKVNAINERLGPVLVADGPAYHSGSIRHMVFYKSCCPKCGKFEWTFYGVTKSFVCEFCKYAQNDTRSIDERIIDLEEHAWMVHDLLWDADNYGKDRISAIKKRIKNIEDSLLYQPSSESSGNSSKLSAEPKETLSIVSHRIYNNQVFVRDSNDREHSMPCFDGVTSQTSSRIGIRQGNIVRFYGFRGNSFEKLSQEFSSSKKK